ncbi:Maf family protein [Planctomicrobium sp. SH527]|uniref:Maf family protein n=1 Tax=Planctomicrobium sp. SH527 TaxID=3448123 RepID=UPI003F5BDC1F
MILLGSQSPRRMELLSRIVPPERIQVAPVDSDLEAGFDGLRTTEEISSQVLVIAETKRDSVLGQLGFSVDRSSVDACDRIQLSRVNSSVICSKPNSGSCSQLNWQVLITADTVVVVSDSDQHPVVLGKPDGPEWERTVRHWFIDYYSGREHQVVTGVCMLARDGRFREFCVETRIRFRSVSQSLLDWYIKTGEPLGKAGGYGLQGAGELFVESIYGSSSNVIGLPLEPVWQTLFDWDLLDSVSD